MHLDLFPAHEVKDAPGGASSATEPGHQDVGVENGFCDGDSDEARSF